MEQASLYKYIEKLHNLLSKNKKDISKYKKKIKKMEKQLMDFDKHKLSSDDLSPEQIKKDTKGDGKKVEMLKQLSPSSENAGEKPSEASIAFSFVDEMRQAAEEAQNLNELIYEPTSGLYYDQKSGYYYNAEFGLYYDGNTGCYYKYNQEKKSYEFHSQVEVQPNEATKADDDDELNDVELAFDEWGGIITDRTQLRLIKEQKQQIENNKRYRRIKKLRSEMLDENNVKKQKLGTNNSLENNDDNVKELNKKLNLDIEDGELSSDCESDSNGDKALKENKNSDEIIVFKNVSRFQDIAKKYPPSLRIIVQETNVETLKVGSLNIITFKGGTLGREGAHDVIIPDLNVSKLHLKFSYDRKKLMYTCIDVGSQNGTLLNGTRMSRSKTESISHDLVHGSIIQIGQTKLLCHMHQGNITCGLCEPGLLIENSRESTSTNASEATNSGNVLTHKEQLKKLQKKYGLENEKFIDSKQNTGNYNDRAATRRIVVGSTTENEKTQMSSVNTEISSENKGFKMLSKLGWNKGDALGKSNSSTGILEPINVSSYEGKQGLGSEQVINSTFYSENSKKKMVNWKRTQLRYEKSKVLEEDSESN